MLLAVDVGNTHIHLGVFRGATLLAHWDVSNRRDRTANELEILLLQLFARAGLSPTDVRGAAMACVVPPVTETVAEGVRRAFGVDPFLLVPGADAPTLAGCENPREVGADRVANAVGGFAKYGGPLIVVDFGTATTFDAIGEDGRYLGGAIAPGLHISVDALFQRTARLPRIELVRPRAAIGRGTVESMQAGVIFGYAGLVEALVRRIAHELGGAPAVVATGGLAELIVRETGAVPVVDQHLTLEGLRIVWERQRGGPNSGGPSPDAELP